MKNKDDIKSVEVFSGSTYQAQMVKNLLENAGIEAFLQDENIGSLHLPWASPGGIGLVKVIVAETEAKEAIKIVEEYIAGQGQNQE